MISGLEVINLIKRNVFRRDGENVKDSIREGHFFKACGFTYLLKFIFIFNVLCYKTRSLHRLLHLTISWLLECWTHVTTTIWAQIIDTGTKKFFVATRR